MKEQRKITKYSVFWDSFLKLKDIFQHTNADNVLFLFGSSIFSAKTVFSMEPLKETIASDDCSNVMKDYIELKRKFVRKCIENLLDLQQPG